MRRLFPRLYPLMGLYFGLRFKRKTEIGPAKRVKLVYAGIRGGKTMNVYEKNTHR